MRRRTRDVGGQYGRGTWVDSKLPAKVQDGWTLPPGPPGGSCRRGRRQPPAERVRSPSHRLWPEVY